MTVVAAVAAPAQHLKLSRLLTVTVTNMYMQMGAESPLSAVGDLVGGGSCQVFLAPLVDDGEDEEGQHPAARNATSGAARN